MRAIIAIIIMLFLLTSCNVDMSGYAITDADIAEKAEQKTTPKETAPVMPEEPIKLCPQNITIASFNIKDFSDKTRTDEELLMITEVLANFDLITVQEVTGDPIILNRTIDMLNSKTGKHYHFEVSKPLGNVQKERYAFIYNTDKVWLEEGPDVYIDASNKFIREPYIAEFRSFNFDFVIVTVHIKYGEGPADRAVEMKEIANVYNYLQSKDAHENDIILTGDFNTQPWEDNFKYIKEEIKDSWYAISKGKTTIGDSGHLYDNIIFTKKATQEYTGAKGIYMFDEILGLTQEEAREKVSDHRPVYAIFCTGTDDD
ncbi:MAG: endonuclease/exonuclease/phosphatase family protein [Candidatus Woesearchaeota archaeon]